MVPQAADLYAHNPAQYRDIPDHLELDHLGEDDMVKIAYINREDIWYAREPAVLLMFHNARAVLQRQQLCTHRLFVERVDEETEVIYAKVANLQNCFCQFPLVQSLASTLVACEMEC